MFSGLVQGLGTITSIEHFPTLLSYTIQLPSFLLKGLDLGASVSVNGVCQSVVSIRKKEVQFHAILETLSCTNLKSLKINQNVNIERSLKMGDEIGGHLLSGHIIDTIKIQAIEALTSTQKIVTLKCAPKWVKYIFAKGFIALNGVSLTVGKIIDPEGYFTVNLIPETLRRTTFLEAKIGDELNLEIDSQTQVIVDTVERILNSAPK